MVSATKINIWPVLSNILLIICIVYIFINVADKKALKKEQAVVIAKELVLKKQIESNKVKIDSLQSEITKRDKIIDDTKRWVVTLEQFKQKYEKTYNSIDTLSIDDNIKFFSAETGNKR